MGKYYETWQNALDQVHNWKPDTNTHQQMLKEAAPPAGVSGGGVKKDDHFEKVKKVKDQINKQKDKVAKFDLGDPKQKTPHALATADLKTMNLKLRDMQSAENEPETDDAGKPNKKKQIKEEPLNEKKADFLRLTFANNQTVKKVERWLYNNLGRANPGYMSMIADDDFIDFEDMNDADGVMTKLKKAGFSFKVDMRWNTTSWGEDLNKDNESFVDKWGHILKIKVGDKVKFVDKGGAHFGKKGKVIRDHGDGSYSVEILFPSGRTLTPNNVKNKDIVKEEVLDEASPTIAKVKDIAKNKQAAKIDGTTVDLFTASAISQVYDKVNDVNKKKMDGMKIIPLANIAMKLLKNEYEPVELDDAVIKEKNND